MEHLVEGLLMRYVDDELTPSEVREAENHLAACESCRGRFHDLRRASGTLDDFILSAPVLFGHNERERLATSVATVERELAFIAGLANQNVKRPSVVGLRHWLQRRNVWAAGVALAACMALVFIMRSKQSGDNSLRTNATQTASVFEVDGEKFWALPYSNPDLPLTGPRVVQMEVPVASLAEAGIVLEPVANRVASPDRAVLADVLLGLDGQPLGVHVVNASLVD